MRDATILGVDFSGAANAGSLIWITAGTESGGRLILRDCIPARGIERSSRQRDVAIAAVGRFVRETRPAVVGLDFPFGLPAALVHDRTWLDFAAAFGDRYRSALEFQRLCAKAAGGYELRRLTDIEARTPFSPYNLRLFRQTFYGIRDLLAPLALAQNACVLPMQSPAPDVPWLLEICPASTLKVSGLGLTGYKRATADAAAGRARVVDWLENHHSVEFSRSVRAAALNDYHGDALDSVLAAFAAWSAINGDALVARSDDARLEGFVYH